MSPMERTVSELVLLIAGGIAVAMFLKRSAASEKANPQAPSQTAPKTTLPFYLVHNQQYAPSFAVPLASGGNENAAGNPVVQNGSAVASIAALIGQAGGAFTGMAANIIRGLSAVGS